MQPPDAARLRAAFADPEPPRGGEPPGASAVLLPLLQRGATEVLLTRRAGGMPTHPGEISLPGGRVEGQEGPLGAALRETEEEVGVARADIEVVGHLADYVTHDGRLVCAYVGLLGPRARPRVASPEVAEVLVVPVAALLDPATYEARMLGDRTVHYWHLPQGTVWGITGDLLARFLERACAWAPPRPPRPVGGPGALLPERSRPDAP